MSSINKALSSKNMINESQEESGWTTYFEDFFNRQNIIEDDRECSKSFFGTDSSSTSLVSDAASGSLGAKKLAEEIPLSKNCKRSSFKKRKMIKTALVDDAFEDTASCPVNSPKVSYDNHLYKEKQKEELDFSQEKGNTSGQRGERNELGLSGKDSDCTELKKRGLCLVPLSMLVNYLG